MSLREVAAGGVQPLLETEELLATSFLCTGKLLPWSREQRAQPEVVLQREGVHEVRFGGAPCLVDHGCFTVTPAGAEYWRNSPTPRRQRSTHLLLEGRVGQAFARQRPTCRPTSPRLALLHHALLQASDGLEAQEAGWALVDEVSALLAVPVEGPERRTWRRLTEEVRHALASGYTERLTLAQLARDRGVSPFHLARLFRAVTGTTIHATLVRLRLRAALHALTDGATDLSRLAVELGFTSPSHFTLAFRQAYGVPPSRLRAGTGRRSGLRCFSFLELSSRAGGQPRRRAREDSRHPE